MSGGSVTALALEVLANRMDIVFTANEQALAIIIGGFLASLVFPTDTTTEQ